MSTNITRRGDRGLGKTIAGGNAGSFAGHQRAAAADPLSSGASSPRRNITVPARQAALVVPAEPAIWLEGLGVPAVSFGEDDSGRFWSQYDFVANDGSEHVIQVTSFGDGDDFSMLDPQTSEVEGWDEARETILGRHQVLECNASIVGVFSCEQDSRLNDLVISTSLGTEDPSDPAYDYDKPAGERAMLRVERMTAGLGYQTDSMTDSDLQDALTDFAWLAKRRGFDFIDLSRRAQEMQEDEEIDPHM